LNVPFRRLLAVRYPELSSLAVHGEGTKGHAEAVREVRAMWRGFVMLYEIRMAAEICGRELDEYVRRSRV